MTLVCQSVNAFTPEMEHQSYDSVDDSVHMLKQGDFMTKLDIRHAYRSVPISWQSFGATDLRWKYANGQSVFMYECELSFAARASPTIFHRHSQSVKHTMWRRGCHNIVGYQDNFLVMENTYTECLSTQDDLIARKSRF